MWSKTRCSIPRAMWLPRIKLKTILTAQKQRTVHKKHIVQFEIISQWKEYETRSNIYSIYGASHKNWSLNWKYGILPKHQNCQIFFEVWINICELINIIDKLECKLGHFSPVCTRLIFFGSVDLNNYRHHITTNCFLGEIEKVIFKNTSTATLQYYYRWGIKGSMVFKSEGTVGGWRILK